MRDDLVRSIVTAAINLVEDAESGYNGVIPEDGEELEELVSAAYRNVKSFSEHYPMHFEIWAEMAKAVVVLKSGKGWPNF